MILQAFWGKPNQTGSLCNLRDYINRKLVDKKGKTFSIADEFISHTFKAHLLAAVYDEFGVTSAHDNIPHDNSLEWLETTARSICEKRLVPHESKDAIHALHRSFLHVAFMYIDLRNAIRNEEGPQIIRHWRHWMVLFVGMNCKNYATEALNLLSNLAANFPQHIAYIATHNRTVNTQGKYGHGKPIDQMLEHYNL